MKLRELIARHSVRSNCRCGCCAPAAGPATLPQPFVDLILFDVALAGSITAEDFVGALKDFAADSNDCNPLDGREHSYLEIGAWVGDQELALRLMGMGTLLQVWQLLTPFTEISAELPKEVALRLAQEGVLSIQVAQLSQQPARADALPPDPLSVDYTVTPYRTDLALLDQLGLSQFSGRMGEEISVGAVTLSDGSTISIWTTGMPALFWRFDIRRAPTGQTFRAETGSGELSTYWPMARGFAEGSFNPDDAGGMFLVEESPATKDSLGAADA